MQLLDIFFKSATIVIAITNLFFVIKFFNLKSKKDDADKEKDRRINWLKTLVLDHSLDSFYSFFDSIESELNKLKEQNLTIDDKKQVDDKIGDQFILLRRNFTDTLIAVDNNLYKSVLSISDKFQTHLTDTIFDNGINLAHPPKYQELVLEKLTISKTDIIKILFGYRG
ncbi:MAG: hypothetical protein JST57_12685 [Bacteroidetes bacterium]|nr:hypothetical protein [Bacteroidota bacterium]